MSLLANSNAIESGGYNIDRSLRFRSSASAYLNRTPASAGNRKTWTLSAWFKRGTLGVNGQLISTNGTTDATNLSLRFDTDDKLWVGVYNTGSVLATTQVFRDPSAWYHLVWLFDTTQATAANRCRLFINGSEITSFSTDARSTYFALNGDYGINTTQSHAIGRNNFAGSQYFDGYLAEVNFIDGQALTPSSFGQTDANTGVWVPAKYTGTYGTNGFYLPFSDNTSATTLAYDKSGNGNNWTANNISTTAGATYDSMTDVPTLTSATAANFAIWNPLQSSGTYSDGNLKFTSTTSYQSGFSSIGVKDGKWYFEATIGTFATDALIGIAATPINASNYSGSTATYLGKTADSWSYESLGRIYNNNSFVSFGSSFTANDIIGVAFDASTGKLWFAKNGVWQGSGDPTNGTTPAATVTTNVEYVFGVTAGNTGNWVVNFGQRPFSYTPPTGFNALNTFNLPDPTIKKPSTQMNVVTYTGNGTSQTISGVGFQPDFVWQKIRSKAYNHRLYDSVRGATYRLQSNTTDAEVQNTQGITAFTSDGFSVGNDLNENESGATMVGWCWKAGGTSSSNTSGSITSTVSVNTTAGFSVVTYTANGVNGATIGHGLGVAPKMIIIKNRTTTYDWPVYHASLGNASTIYLDTTGASSGGMWNSTSPTSSVFTISSNAYVNNTGNNYVAYCWAEIAGFSKFGSYTGNGAAYPSGVFVYTGFRPRFLLIKMSGRAGTYWELRDTARSPYNSSTVRLDANNANAEESSNQIDILSNGFVVTGSDAGINGSGDSYIYAAFAENPFKYSLAR